MCEYCVSVKYADNKFCHDNGLEGEYIRPDSFTTDWNVVKSFYERLNQQISERKSKYPYTEESAKIMVSEVTDWCEALNKE